MERWRRESEDIIGFQSGEAEWKSDLILLLGQTHNLVALTQT